MRVHIYVLQWQHIMRKQDHGRNKADPIHCSLMYYRLLRNEMYFSHSAVQYSVYSSHQSTKPTGSSQHCWWLFHLDTMTCLYIFLSVCRTTWPTLVLYSVYRLFDRKKWSKFWLWDDQQMLLCIKREHRNIVICPLRGGILFRLRKPLKECFEGPGDDWCEASALGTGTFH